MKKILFAGVIALACGMAQAQSNSPLYIGGTIGQSKISVDIPGFDESDTGYKIYGGYQINPNFALELGYASFGEASHPFPAKFEADAFYGAAVGRIEFTKELTGVGRIGIANVDVKYTEPGFSESESNMKLIYGLGLEYSFTKNLKGVAAIDFTEGEIEGNKGSMHLISLGAQYSF